MTGTYTDIVEIVAPASAAAGEIVAVTVKVKNIDTVYDHVIRLIASAYDIDGNRYPIIDEVALIPSGEIHSFSGSFTMPSKSGTIWAYSYYPIAADWIYDDSSWKDISVTEVVTEFSQFAIASFSKV